MNIPDKTEGAVLFDLDEPLAIEELVLPDLSAGQVLVEIAYSGVCHTQLLEVRGKRGEDRYLPHTLGHEGSGRVLAIGVGVTKVAPGDHVVLTWIKGTGAEVGSVQYQSKMGSINSGAISTFMRHAVVSENRLVPVDKELPLREAALLGCALPTGMGMVFNTAGIRPGNSIAVFGVGGIGLSAILAADLLRASPIIAVDIFEHKLDQAQQMGATHLVDASSGDPLAAIRELTGGRGVDVTVEAVGKSETAESAFKAVRDGGGLCVLAGNVPHGVQISLDPFDLIRGKRIVGSWGGETEPDRDLPLYAGFLKSGDLQVDQLITDVFTLDKINEALGELECGNVGRVLIEMDGRKALFAGG